MMSSPWVLHQRARVIPTALCAIHQRVMLRGAAPQPHMQYGADTVVRGADRTHQPKRSATAYPTEDFPDPATPMTMALSIYSEAVMPPSTYRIWPFTKLDAGEDKKIAAPTSSSTLPQRPAGVRFSSHAENSTSATSAALSGVSK